VRKKKVLFIQPPLTLTETYGKMARSRTMTPPLGLCSLAAVTRLEGYETKILDAEALRLSFEETVERIVEESPDYIGMTAVTISVGNAAKLAEMIKEHYRKTIIIIGGPHLTAVPEETMDKFRAFDIGVIGEGEVTIVELLNALAGGGNVESVKGLIIRDGENTKRTGPREFISDMDRLPMPAWDLLPELTSYYRTPTHNLSRTPSTSLLTSRGCTGRCLFCSRKVFGNRVRGYSAGYIIRMIRHLQKQYGIRDVIIFDDTFVMMRKRLVEFCNILLKERIDLTWACNARVDLVTPEILKLMRRAGCWQIGYGIESGSQKILDLLNKRTTIAQIERALGWTRNAGIRARGFFMIGSFGETEETIRQTMGLAKRLPIDEFQMSFFTPFPGSEAYRVARSYGETCDDWAKMSLWEPAFVPTGLTREKMVSFQRKAFLELYLRPKRIFSYLRRIRNWENLVKAFKGGATLLRLLSPW